MIRLSKPVKLLEWGEGTNTLNQIWTEIGQGRVVSERTKNGLTTLTIQLSKGLEKKNPRDNSIKVAQQGEGLTGRSDSWGEVAMGQLRSVESGGTVVVIEIPAATKVDRRH